MLNITHGVLPYSLSNYTICPCVQARYDDEDEDDGPAADPQLEAGMPLPIRLARMLLPLVRICLLWRSATFTDYFVCSFDKYS